MSSHREAPEISKDPVADNTDVYAFVSPDHHDRVTIIANYLPLEGPAGGPNFFEFGDDVLYQIHIDNDGDADANITYQFRFRTTIRNPNTFLYNTGRITSLTDTHWNRPQTYTVTKVVKGEEPEEIGEDLLCPPCNIGPRSTPNYPALAAAAVKTLPSGETVFAGQRDDPFFVDIGSIFDLADLRPIQNLHAFSSPAAPGVDTTKGLNVHTIAIQVPKRDLTADGHDPTDKDSARSVLGVWATASRRKVRMLDPETGTIKSAGPWVQVSRLGNPLFNEVIVPMSKKDLWNTLSPSEDSQFAAYVAHPELAGLLPILYPGHFPHLAALSAPRADLLAILLTGIPTGIVPGFQNFTGPRQADMLRLNMAIPPSASENPLGLVGGDPAGFPNGRRLNDDVVTIELRAVAGLTYPLVASYTPDGAVGAITDGLTSASNPVPLLPSFPYVGTPNDGYDAGA